MSRSFDRRSTVPGLSIVGLGLLMNGAVYSFNGGFMPVAETALTMAGNQTALVLREGGRLQKTFLMQPDTPLRALGDVVPIAPVHKVYSPGDLVATMGVFVLVAAGMRTQTRVRS